MLSPTITVIFLTFMLLSGFAADNKKRGQKKVGEMKDMKRGERKEFADSINGTEIVDADNCSIAYIDTQNMTNISFPPDKGGKMRMALKNWGQAQKMVIQAFRGYKEDFEALGLKWQDARRAFLVNVDRIAVLNATDADYLTNATFTFIMSGLTVPASSIKVFSYSDATGAKEDVVAAGGSVNVLSSDTLEITATHTSAFSGEVVDTSSTMGTGSSTSADDKKRGQKKIGEMKDMKRGERKQFADTIKKTEIYDVGNCSLAYVDTTNNTDIPVPSDKGGKVRMAVKNWGQAQKAVIQAFRGYKEDFEALGLKWQDARRAFLVNVDRIAVLSATDADYLTNATFTFIMSGLTVPASSIQVFSYSDASGAKEDVVAAGGKVTALSNDTLEVTATHTSAFSGEVADTTATTSGSTNAFSVQYTTLLALAALHLLSVALLW